MTLSALLDICESLVSSGLLSQMTNNARPFDISFVVSLNEVLNEYSSHRWCCTPQRCDVTVTLPVKDVSAYGGIHSTEGVIKQIDLSVLVEGPGQTDTGLLTSTQHQTTLSYQRAVTMWKSTQILELHRARQAWKHRGYNRHFSDIFKCIFLNSFVAFDSQERESYLLERSSPMLRWHQLCMWRQHMNQYKTYSHPGKLEWLEEWRGDIMILFETFKKILVLSIMVIPLSGPLPSVPGDIGSRQRGDQMWYFASRMKKTPRVVVTYMPIAHRPWHFQRSMSTLLIGTAEERTANQEWTYPLNVTFGMFIALPSPDMY